MGSDTAADHITATQPALAQLSKTCRRGRRTLVRTDSGVGTRVFVVNWLIARGRWLSYSAGMTMRLFSASARLITTGPRRYPRLPSHWPWPDVVTAVADRLQALPDPG